MVIKMPHYSVLLNESVELLSIKADGLYIDGTFGRGGHTQAILAKLNEQGRLIAFDKDPEAIAYAKEFILDKRFTIIHGSFSSLLSSLDGLKISKIDGLLLDLGVSSPQLDTQSRGFSFRFDAILDMRMDNTIGQSANEWINSANEEDIAYVLWHYGEERFSRKIAKAIIARRTQEPIVTTTQLAKLISENIHVKDKAQHPATKSFQAIRIFINNELGDLEKILLDSPKLLNKGARIVVISFHSLEDRIVKQAFNNLVSTDKFPKWVMVQNSAPEYKVIAKKIKASDKELAENKRSRSAVMRSLEKL